VIWTVNPRFCKRVDELKGLFVFGSILEVVSAEILVEGSGLEHMVGGWCGIAQPSRD
jgi:hypothetical protein